MDYERKDKEYLNIKKVFDIIHHNMKYKKRGHSMPHNDPNNMNYLWATILLFKDLLLGVVGGAIAYLFDYSKADREGQAFAFQMSSLLVNMALGGFVAYLVGTLLANDINYRDAVVGLTGVTSYQILLIAESKFAIWVFDKLTGDSKDDTRTTKWKTQ